MLTCVTVYLLNIFLAFRNVHSALGVEVSLKRPASRWDGLFTVVFLHHPNHILNILVKSEDCRKGSTLSHNKLWKMWELVTALLRPVPAQSIQWKKKKRRLRLICLDGFINPPTGLASELIPTPCEQQCLGGGAAKPKQREKTRQRQVDQSASSSTGSAAAYNPTVEVLF